MAASLWNGGEGLPELVEPPFAAGLLRGPAMAAHDALVTIELGAKGALWKIPRSGHLAFLVKQGKTKLVSGLEMTLTPLLWKSIFQFMYIASCSRKLVSTKN